MNKQIKAQLSCRNLPRFHTPDPADAGHLNFLLRCTQFYSGEILDDGKDWKLSKPLKVFPEDLMTHNSQTSLKKVKDCYDRQLQKASVRKQTNKTNQQRDPEQQTKPTAERRPKPQPPPSPLSTQHKMEAAPQRCAVPIGWEPLRRSCQSTLSPARGPEKRVYVCEAVSAPPFCRCGTSGGSGVSLAGPVLRWCEMVVLWWLWLSHVPFMLVSVKDAADRGWRSSERCVCCGFEPCFTFCLCQGVN